MPPSPSSRRPGLVAFALLVGLGAASSSLPAQVRVRFGVRTPMRDGAVLVSDAWMPAGPGRFPTILVRTPYERTMELLPPSGRPPEFGEYFARHGYVWMIQDTRGRGDSEGEFHFFRDDGRDGYDAIEWIAKQPWSDGRVCTMGVSYLATVQWLAAKEKPPHLVCIAPTAAAGRWFDELPYLGGALQVQFMLGWTYRTTGRTYGGANAIGLDWSSIYAHRPLATMDQRVGKEIPAWREFIDHPTHDDYWKRIELTAADFAALDLPALHVTGWFDWDQPGALHYWRGMAARSPAAANQFLLIGPWTHPQTWVGGALSLGEWKFSGSSIVDYRPIALAFFDRYLKRTADRFAFPRARLYLTGIDRWLDVTSFPPEATKSTRLYLRSGGRANSLAGDGALDWSPPETEPPDRFAADPANPVPSSIAGLDPRGIDHRPIERRDDVLVYTSTAVADTMVAIGPVFVTLSASTDGPDTDFTAKLLDVAPDGRALKLGPTEVGVIRARYRAGADQLRPVLPNAVAQYRIELFDVGHAFLPGHRIRLEVASSAFPFIDVNLNTGRPTGTDTTGRIAHQTIHHDRDRLSFVELPLWSPR